MSDETYTRFQMEMLEKITLLSSQVTAMHARLDEVVSRQQYLDRRVTALERAQIWSKGWIAGVGAVAALLGGLASEFVRRYM